MGIPALVEGRRLAHTGPMTETISPGMADSRPAQALRSLTGTWRNELGSELVLEDDHEGVLSGRYHSGAGALPGVAYPVCGSSDPAPNGSCRVLGFVVDWKELHALTVWSGQYHSVDDTIRATWVMTTETKENEEWRSTFIGHDVFRRV